MNAPASRWPAPTLSARDGALWLEELPLAEIAARFGTPTYVYSRAALEAAFAAWKDALAGRRADRKSVV